MSSVTVTASRENHCLIEAKKPISEAILGPFGGNGNGSNADFSISLQEIAFSVGVFLPTVTPLPPLLSEKSCEFLRCENANFV